MSDKFKKALALRRLGQLDESLELLHHVHEKYVSMYCETDTTTLMTKSEIAFVHYIKKEFTKALEIWEKVEAGFTHKFGELADVFKNNIRVRNNIALCKAKLSQRAKRAIH